MDPYKTLGLSRDATKEQIKDSFRRCALDFHPDRHVRSSEAVRQRAILSFKQASAAYEVLIDDRKRADYDFSRRRGASPANSAGFGGGGGGGRRSAAGVGGSGLDVEFMFRLMTTRGFLIGLVFASLLVGGAVVAERSVDALWKLNNSGKSFEDAMESIEKVRLEKENS